MNREPLPQSPTRIHAIDWLRVLAVCAIFFAHVAHIFAFGTAASIQNGHTSLAATAYFYFVLQWAVALLFLLAGTSNWFSLRSRANGSYLRERLLRLLIPLVFGSIVLIPWIGYLRALNHATFAGPYWQYLPIHIEQTRTWLATPELRHGLIALYYTSWHLWFLGYLLIYSVLSLPLLRHVPRATWLAAFCEGRLGLTMLGLPIVLVKVMCGPTFPDYLDWSDTLVFFTLFVYGWLFMTDARFMRAVERDALVWLPVACVSFALLLAAHALGYMVEWLARPAYTLDYMLYQALLGISMWAWVLALAGCGLRWLHVDNALLRYAGAAVLPFYIVHQAAIATVAVVVVRWNAGITAKFLVISSVAFAMTMIAYELLIRRSALLRLAFGVKRASDRRAVARLGQPAPSRSSC